MTSLPRVTHVVTGLGLGGAESMLVKLLRATPGAAGRCHVVALGSSEPLGQEIQALGVPVTALGLSGGVADIARLPRLRRVISEAKPDVVQTWMYHADLLGGLAVASLGRSRPALSWSIRSSTFDAAGSNRRTVRIAKVNARLSRWLPDVVVACSPRARDIHVGMGWDQGSSVVIPNGFETDRFRPDPGARRALRSELGIGDLQPTIAYVARFDPQKDHRSFFQSLGRVATVLPEVVAVVCGVGAEPANQELSALVQEAGVGDRVKLLGPRRDVPRVFAGSDLAVSTSAFGEGFPNTIGEAMSCGVPAVVTDVGDSGWVVGETGRVVPARSPERFAEACVELLTAPAEQRASRAVAARERIRCEFSIDSVAGRYDALYADLRKGRAVVRAR